MDLTEKGLLLAVFVVIATTYFFATAKARVVDGNVAIPTKTNFILFKDGSEADGTVKFKTTKIIPAGTEFAIDIRDNQLSERPEDRAKRDKVGFTALEYRNRAFIESFDFPFDLGTWGGFASDADESFQVGLRVAPVRLLFGTTSPDFLIAPDYAGVGLSAYPPPDLVGHMWSHWGLGYGHLWSTHSGGSSNVFYLSFTTQIP